jgi:hypothetical protein
MNARRQHFRATPQKRAAVLKCISNDWYRCWVGTPQEAPNSSPRCRVNVCHVRAQAYRVSSRAEQCRMGLAFGYISAVAYLKSRVSQILKNWTRGDAEGLSILMFLCAICGNMLGGCGIVVRLSSVSEMVWQLPWLVGMLGTVSMDVVLAWQAYHSKHHGGSRGGGSHRQQRQLRHDDGPSDLARSTLHRESGCTPLLQPP